MKTAGVYCLREGGFPCLTCGCTTCHKPTTKATASTPGSHICKLPDQVLRYWTESVHLHFLLLIQAAIHVLVQRHLLILVKNMPLISTWHKRDLCHDSRNASPASTCGVLCFAFDSNQSRMNGESHRSLQSCGVHLGSELGRFKFRR